MPPWRRAAPGALRTHSGLGRTEHSAVLVHTGAIRSTATASAKGGKATSPAWATRSAIWRWPATRWRSRTSWSCTTASKSRRHSRRRSRSWAGAATRRGATWAPRSRIWGRGYASTSATTSLRGARSACVYSQRASMLEVPFVGAAELAKPALTRTPFAVGCSPLTPEMRRSRLAPFVRRCSGRAGGA